MADAAAPITSIEEPGVKAQGDLLHAMRREVADLLDRNSTNFPGAQPVSFSRQHISELVREEYVVLQGARQRAAIWPLSSCGLPHSAGDGPVC